MPLTSPNHPRSWLEHVTSNSDREKLLQQIIGLVNINSGSTNIEGITTVQHSLAELLAPVGEATVGDPIEIDAIDDAGNQSKVTCGSILELSIRPDMARRLLIVGHADTVFSPSSSFQTATLSGDRLHGPGTADMKGGLVLAAEALRLVEQAGTASGIGIDLLVSGDEETGSLASAPRIAELSRAASVGIALEPPMADGSIARARAGSANITVVINGRSAHAGRALDDGRNAVVAAAKLAIAAEAEGANVASIHGGEAFNSVPDLCVLKLNKRGATPADIEVVLSSLRRSAAELSEALEVSFEFHGHQHRPAKPWSDASEQLATVVKIAASEFGRELNFADTFGVCDGNNMAAEGIGVIDTLGIQGANIHTANEFAVINNLDDQVGLLCSVISHIADKWSQS